MPSAPRVLLAHRYQLTDRIATGGYGEVWRGTDTVLTRPVAVKLLQSGHDRRPETLARFRAEAQHAGALTHKGIARVYDYGEPAPPEPPFLIMELIEGPSLADLVAAGPLEPARVMDVVAQVAAGLHAAHRAGLVHRDIKPGNLLISPDGIVKITDFGISYAAGSAPVTATGQLVGTAGYVAPERAAGGPGSAASDLYSLGVVAYQCLTGRLPFSGDPLQMALAHLVRPMPPLPASVPAEVAALVSRLTAKDPADRPRTAGEVADKAAWLRDLMISTSVGMSAVLIGPAGGARPEVLPDADDRPWDSSYGGSWYGGSWYGGSRPNGGWLRSGWRKTRLAGLGAVAAMLALMLTSLGSPTAQDRAAAVPSSTSAPPVSQAALVEVNPAGLIGRPLSGVLSTLRQMGLTVRVRWQTAGQAVPGTVLSVRPTGWLRPASRVVVMGARQPVRRDVGGGHGAGAGPGHDQARDKGQARSHGEGHGSADGQGQNND